MTFIDGYMMACSLFY